MTPPGAFRVLSLQLPRRRRRDGVESVPRAGEQCGRWQLRRVRLATEVETGFPFLLHGVPAPLESPIPFAAASCEVPSWLNTSARRRNRDDVASMA